MSLLAAALLVTSAPTAAWKLPLPSTPPLSGYDPIVGTPPPDPPPPPPPSYPLQASASQSVSVGSMGASSTIQWTQPIKISVGTNSSFTQSASADYSFSVHQLLKTDAHGKWTPADIGPALQLGSDYEILDNDRGWVGNTVVLHRMHGPVEKARHGLKAKIRFNKRWLKHPVILRATLTELVLPVDGDRHHDLGIYILK